MANARVASSPGSFGATMIALLGLIGLIGKNHPGPRRTGSAWGLAASVIYTVPMTTSGLEFKALAM